MPFPVNIYYLLFYIFFCLLANNTPFMFLFSVYGQWLFQMFSSTVNFFQQQQQKNLSKHGDIFGKNYPWIIYQTTTNRKRLIDRQTDRHDDNLKWNIKNKSKSLSINIFFPYNLLFSR